MSTEYNGRLNSRMNPTKASFLAYSKRFMPHSNLPYNRESPFSRDVKNSPGDSYSMFTVLGDKGMGLVALPVVAGLC